MREKLSLRRRNRLVPIFLAADDKYTPFMSVTMKSIIANASDRYRYLFHVLHTDITIENQAMLKRLETDNCEILFVDVREELKKIEKKFPSGIIIRLPPITDFLLQICFRSIKK